MRLPAIPVNKLFNCHLPLLCKSSLTPLGLRLSGDSLTGLQLTAALSGQFASERLQREIFYFLFFADSDMPDADCMLLILLTLALKCNFIDVNLDFRCRLSFQCKLFCVTGFRRGILIRLKGSFIKLPTRSSIAEQHASELFSPSTK